VIKKQTIMAAKEKYGKIGKGNESLCIAIRSRIL